MLFLSLLTYYFYSTNSHITCYFKSAEKFFQCVYPVDKILILSY